jgi:hypothetical protein
MFRGLNDAIEKTSAEYAKSAAAKVFEIGKC